MRNAKRPNQALIESLNPQRDPAKTTLLALLGSFSRLATVVTCLNNGLGRAPNVSHGTLLWT